MSVMTTAVRAVHGCALAACVALLILLGEGVGAAETRTMDARPAAAASEIAGEQPSDAAEERRRPGPTGRWQQRRTVTPPAGAVCDASSPSRICTVCGAEGRPVPAERVVRCVVLRC